MDPDQTVSMPAGQSLPAKERCPVCDAELLPDENDLYSLRCPVCNYVSRHEELIAPGDVIGNKYRILSHLKNGGSGQLFLCHPLDDAGVRYVLKILKAKDPASRQRFRREAEILASISCRRNVVRLIDLWESEKDIFIIMEYIDGKNLRQLKRAYEFDETATLEIAREVAGVLARIWDDNGIIHRDIKPENIMLDKEFKLKLLDFGLSKQCGSGGCTDITMVNIGLGTPGYMSPEQIRDSKSVDFRSDIFSLGATMFFLLTGDKPFSGNTAMEICQNTLVETPPAVARFKGRCSSQCITVIRRMMERKPEDRYPSYSELLADIDSLLAAGGG